MDTSENEISVSSAPTLPFTPHTGNHSGHSLTLSPQKTATTSEQEPRLKVTRLKATISWDVYAFRSRDLISSVKQEERWREAGRLNGSVGKALVEQDGGPESGS